MRTVEIIDWLEHHAAETEQIAWMAHQVAACCTEALAANPGTPKRFADHFWCNVIASLVQVLDELTESADKLPAAVSQATVPVIGADTWTMVKQSRDVSLGNRPTSRATSRAFQTQTRRQRDLTAGLHDALLEKVVEQLVAILLQGAIGGVHLTFDELLVKLRVLGVLLCPDPYSHSAVWNQCALALLEKGVVIRTQNFLDRFLALFRTQWAWTP